MFTKKHPVQLVNEAGEIRLGTFILDEAEDGDQCRLVIQLPDGEIAAEAWNYFDAMCQIRLALEIQGWRPVCFGSSQNVYPSNMCKDMGRGLKAYKMELGRRAKLADLVSIFGTAPDVKPGSVYDQRQFFERWLQNLGINL